MSKRPASPLPQEAKRQRKGSAGGVPAERPLLNFLQDRCAAALGSPFLQPHRGSIAFLLGVVSALTGVTGDHLQSAYNAKSPTCHQDDVYFVAASELGAKLAPADREAAQARLQLAYDPAAHVLPDFGAAPARRGVPFAELTDRVTLRCLLGTALRRPGEVAAARAGALVLLRHPRVARVFDRPLASSRLHVLSIYSRDAIYLLTHVVFVFSGYGLLTLQAPEEDRARWRKFLLGWLAWLDAKPLRTARNAEVRHEILSCLIVLAKPSEPLPAAAEAALAELAARTVPEGAGSPFRTYQEPRICPHFEDWHTHATVAHALALYAARQERATSD